MLKRWFVKVMTGDDFDEIRYDRAAENLADLDRTANALSREIRLLGHNIQSVKQLLLRADRPVVEQ